MIRIQKSVRVLGAGLCTLTLVGLACLAPPTQVQAADCGEGGAGGIGNGRWVSTAEAQLRTLNGDCPEGAVCQEWCLTVCHQDEPQGVFDCFPE